jgi:hypothetical protein
MLIGIAFVICLLTVPLAGGRMRALALLQPRAWWLLAAGLGLQVLIISVVPDGPRGMHTTAHIASYVLVACFVLANRSVPYLWLIAFGGALNAIAIGLNGGVMPADPDALAAAGVATDQDKFANSIAVADPVVPFLGDVFWVPESWPVSNVFSVGDVLIVVGVLLAVHTIARSRLALDRFAVPGRRRLAHADAGAGS